MEEPFSLSVTGRTEGSLGRHENINGIKAIALSPTLQNITGLDMCHSGNKTLQRSPKTFRSQTSKSAPQCQNEVTTDRYFSLLKFPLMYIMKTVFLHIVQSFNCTILDSSLKLQETEVKSLKAKTFKLIYVTCIEYQTFTWKYWGSNLI